MLYKKSKVQNYKICYIFCEKGETEGYLFLFSCICINQFKKDSKETSSSDYLHGDDSCGENGVNRDRNEKKTINVHRSLWRGEECAHIGGVAEICGSEGVGTSVFLLGSNTTEKYFVKVSVS